MIHSTFVFTKQVLRQDTRLVSPSLMRLGILVVTIFSLTTSYTTWSIRGGGGLDLIYTLTNWNLFIIGVLSIPYFSSVITEEKEAQTIGLLRMTGIRPVSLLLGKSFPRQLNAMLLLTLQFPFTLLAITLGGVMTNQVIAVYCTLLSFLIMIANICLFCSVVSSRSRSASWLAFGIIMIIPIFSGLFAILGFGFNFGFWQGVLSYVWAIAPFGRIYEILSTGFNGDLVGYQFYSNLIIGAVFFFLSWLTFEKFVKSDLPALAPARGIKQKSSLLKKSDGKISTRKTGRVWENALIWKEFFFTVGGFRHYKFKLVFYPLVAMIAVVIAAFGPRVRLTELMEIFAATLQITMCILLLLEPAIAVSKMFRDEINWKTYTSLYMLPVSIGEVAIKKLLGSALGLFPALFYLFVGIVLSSVVDNKIYFLEFLEEVASEPLITFSFISTYLLFLSLVFYLSLLIKRGSIPLAIVGMWMFYMFLGMFVALLLLGGGGGDEALAFMLILLNLGLAAMLLNFGRKKLVSLASAE